MVKLMSRFKNFIAKQLLKNHGLISPLLPSGYRPYTFPGGKIFLNLRESQMMLKRYFHRYEISMRLVLEKKLSPGGVFVDVGANSGDFALIAAKIVGESGSVLAVEPEPENCFWIRKSIELNHYSNIRLYEVALSDTIGSAELYLGDNSGWHSLIPYPEHHTKGTISVSTMTLDDVIRESAVEKVDMIKIDVEGAELEVLKGAHQTISENREIIILMEVHPFLGVQSSEVALFLERLGFTLFHLKNDYSVPIRDTSSMFQFVAFR